MREGGEVRAGEKIITMTPNGWQGVTIPTIRGEEWLADYLILEEVGNGFLGLAMAFKRLAVGENPSSIFRAYPKGAYSDAIRKAAAYAKQYPDAPPSLSRLGDMTRRFESACVDLSGEDAEKAGRARLEAVEAYADSWAHYAILWEAIGSLFERERLKADVLDAQADAAAARNDFEEERRLRTEAEKKRELAEKDAAQWERRHDAALGLKSERDDAMDGPGDVAARLQRVEESLTPQERSLRDWVRDGKSQSAWGRWREAQGLQSSKAYASGVWASLDRKYREAGFAGAPFEKSKGGRPLTKRTRENAVGTAEDAELRGRLDSRAKTPNRLNSDSRDG